MDGGQPGKKNVVVLNSEAEDFDERVEVLVDNDHLHEGEGRHVGMFRGNFTPGEVISTAPPVAVGTAIRTTATPSACSRTTATTTSRGMPPASSTASPSRRTGRSTTRRRKLRGADDRHPLDRPGRPRRLLGRHRRDSGRRQSPRHDRRRDVPRPRPPTTSSTTTSRRS